MTDWDEVSVIAEVERLLAAIETDSSTRVESLDRLLCILPTPTQVAESGLPRVMNRERVATLLDQLRIGAPAMELPPAVRQLWARYEDGWLTADMAGELSNALTELQEPIAARREAQTKRRRELETAEQRVEALTTLADVLDRLLDARIPVAAAGATTTEVR